MTLRVDLTPEAEADLAEIHAWYAERGIGRRFPYCVFYVIEAERVVVHGCFHARRDPQSWQLRVR